MSAQHGKPLETLTDGAAVELETLDLRARANEGFWLQLRDPRNGRKIPARLRLLGADADACRLKFRTWRRLRATVLLGHASDEAELAAVQALCEAATVGWERLAVKGEPYEFKPERVAELYARWPWLVDLVAEAISNRANFTTSSASS